MHFGKIAALAIIGILSAASTITLFPYAFGQGSGNPIEAIWDAINDLQGREDNLQAQIDDLRATRDTSPLPTSGSAVADPSVKVEMENEDSQDELLIRVHATNSGPDRAAGVRVTIFYKMSALQVDSISGLGCRDLSRGIIQCEIGTIDSGDESIISIHARAVEEDLSSLTVDLSSVTTDLNPGNNRSVSELSISAIEGSTGTDQVESPADTTGDDPQITNDTTDQPKDGDTGTSGNQTSSNSDSSESGYNNSTSSAETSSEQSNQSSSSPADNNSTSSSSDRGSSNSTDRSSDESDSKPTASSSEDDDGSEEQRNDSSQSESESGNQTSSDTNQSSG